MTAAREARDGVPAQGDVPLPEPLPGLALDSHCHLDLIDRPPAEVIAAATAAGIARLVTIGVDLASSRWAASCAGQHDGVYAAVAIHPNETASAAVSPAERDAVLAEIAELAALPQVRAIGETGLDYYRDYASPQVQREWFRAHIAIAKQAGVALMIHDREAHDDVFALLDEQGPPDTVIFHCFSGDADMAKRCAAAGYVMSFAGNITFKNAQPLRDAAAVAPVDLLLVETDAPFLTPVPHRGKPNSPALAAYTVRALAGLKQLPVGELCTQLTATGERVFGPW
ncbi:MAG TPA: TatD family hydrolase [Streptosporangiaceae bacterium]|nr:TatD family hydrolase [Streptosporangiaceae bacterium]